MCTLAIAFQARPDLPLAVAANRDELYSRPAKPPAVYHNVSSAPKILMPLDAQEGGTWLGFNARGLFVGVTNRAGVPRDPARRSRGLLVRDALSAMSARELHAQLAKLAGDHYSAFHLACCDGASAFVTWSDGARVHQQSLAPGVHVFSERSFGAAAPRAEARLQRSLEELLARELPTPRALRELVRFHGPEGAPFDGACVHAEAFGYGTRSSFELVAPAGREPQAIFTDGPPCVTEASDLGALLVELVK
jgi:uncharacterized protein with NRDE domain